MKLLTEDFLVLKAVADKAAREAGRMIASRVGRHVDVLEKTAGSTLASSVLTEVDMQSQALILDHIEPTLNRFDLGLLSEEQQDDSSRFSKDYFWCIDPLDGTLSFINGQPGFSVSISLVRRDGTPVLGVVYDPSAKNVYSAVSGCGAFKNGEPWHPVPSFKCIDKGIKGNPVPLTWIYDRSFSDHPRFLSIQQEIHALAKEQGYSAVQVIDHGGAVLNALWVLEHQPAVYFKLPKKSVGGGSLWDFAATALIVAEAGGHCSDIRGNLLNLNPQDTTYMNDRGILYASESSLADEVQNLVRKY